MMLVLGQERQPINEPFSLTELRLVSLVCRAVANRSPLTDECLSNAALSLRQASVLTYNPLCLLDYVIFQGGLIFLLDTFVAKGTGQCFILM